MKLQTLWYVRRGDQVSGPFPPKLVSREWMLGRYRGTDEVSADQVLWMPLEGVAELRPRVGGIKYRVVGSAEAPLDWVHERRAAALRWMDERQRSDRRKVATTGALVHNRRGPDRRLRAENPAWAKLRQEHAQAEQQWRARRERFIGLGLALLAGMALVVWGALQLAPVRPVKVGLGSVGAACANPAAPRVNWSRCDKSGGWLQGADLQSARLRGTRLNAANLSLSQLTYADLRGADLSFANLAQAKLTGADLRSANLGYADLRNTDLRHADLRNADLKGANLLGARLDDATWPDGRTCATVSVGECQ